MSLKQDDHFAETVKESREEKGIVEQKYNHRVFENLKYALNCIRDFYAVFPPDDDNDKNSPAFELQKIGYNLWLFINKYNK
ncbi:MAG: hypothetical protein GX625_00065 [Clostridiaceae bacterium]|nr:hypothetical protein [Clostridiaceae bacterium]